MKKHRLKYYSAAEDSMDGWERCSLPVGNGFAGASVFGGVKKERVQITTNVFANTVENGGVSDFAEIYLCSDPGNTVYYERGLDLDCGTIYSFYTVGGNKTERKCFYSYPDRVFVYRVDGTCRQNFQILLKIPYLGVRPVEQGGRKGKVYIDGNSLVMRGSLPSRELLFEGRLCVQTDGFLRAEEGIIYVENALRLTFLFCFETSYSLCPEVFFENCHKATGEDPHKKVVALMHNALHCGYEKLYARHQADYTALIGRVSFDLGGKEDGRSTDRLLASVKDGNYEPYFEEVYYAFGRHLLVSSSREDTPPASLQGVWSAYDKSPWGSGFWHNINVQMNYWHAFSTNLSETFLAYAAYFKAYFPEAMRCAENWIKQNAPDRYEIGKCGWIVGTAAFCYEIEGLNPHTHSGPGTGGLTAKMFWDLYDFTRDDKILKDDVFPAVHGLSAFFTKCVKRYGKEYLCSFSASPEQILSGTWADGKELQQYYHTIGCAFDQQMISENAKDDLKCAVLLGVFDKTVEEVHKQFPHYAPIRIGYSGQIKEYAEEHFYGEIGEAKHRHISQLVALMPGTQIVKDTPAWLDSARRTLDLRGDRSTGWALAHRICARARTGDGDRAYSLLRNLWGTKTYPNLWNVHPPFQIDGNFGAVAGMTEMLLQSHDGCIEIFPALPEHWKEVKFCGLKARGNFTVSASFSNGRIEYCSIVSHSGEPLTLRIGNAQMNIRDENGVDVPYARSADRVLFETETGKIYRVEYQNFPKTLRAIENFTAEWKTDCVALRGKVKNSHYLVLRAIEDDCDYTELTTTGSSSYADTVFSKKNKARLTYKIIGYDGEKPMKYERGAVAFLHPADQLETDRYRLRFETNNLYAETEEK